jgi:hypothetical protein
MAENPGEAASKADSEYGLRAKVAFNSLGTAPIEVLMEEGEMTIQQMRQALEENEEVTTVQRQGLEKYFEVLEDFGFADYTEEGSLFTAWNSKVAKNGAHYQEIEEFVEMYTD